MVNFSKDVALLSVVVVVQKSSSFVFAWLCIVLRCWLLLSILFGRPIKSWCQFYNNTLYLMSWNKYFFLSLMQPVPRGLSSRKLEEKFAVRNAEKTSSMTKLEEVTVKLVRTILRPVDELGLQAVITASLVRMTKQHTFSKKDLCQLSFIFLLEC